MCIFFVFLLSKCLIKPPVKESTRPVDLKLHSDVRALERAEFDHQVFLFYFILFYLDPFQLHI